MSISEQSRGTSGSAEFLRSLKEKLRFSDWPLSAKLVAGFNPLTDGVSQLKEYRLERKSLLRPVVSRVTRKYFLRRGDSHVELLLTVIVSQVDAREAAEGLIQQIAASQMGSDPYVTFEYIGDVTIYRKSVGQHSVAFLRNNVGINLDSQTPVESSPKLVDLAQEIDRRLKEQPASETLTGTDRVPKIALFEPKLSVIRPNERTDLVFDILDAFPPHDLLFEAVNGSYNLDELNEGQWYFRAGHHKGTGEVTLTVVNDINLMTSKRITISIEEKG